MQAVGFEQAVIKVENEKEFEELKGAINRALARENAGKYLKRVASAGLRIRNFDLVLAKGVLEQVDGALAGADCERIVRSAGFVRSGADERVLSVQD